VNTIKYIVKEEAGIRLDAYLSKKNKDISRTSIQRLIEEGNILVNNNQIKASYKVNENDVITVNIPEAKEIELKAEKIDIDIIYEDNDIIVINKPKGLVVHPANGNPDGTLVNALIEICKDSLSGIGGEIRPGIVHRLDKDTSGILVVAKNDKAHINLSEQIKKRQMEKIYIALVRGNVKESQATINMPIGRSNGDRKKMAVTKNGKEAITHFKVLERYEKNNNKYSLLEIKIDTGRTHQIRVHLAQIGYPVIGDYIYSNGKNEFGIIGQCLHSKSLKFIHPITEKEMYLEAELPKYFKEVIESLEN